MQDEIICILICLPVVILCQASISNRVVTSRQLSPTALTGQGQISGPNPQCTEKTDGDTTDG